MLTIDDLRRAVTDDPNDAVMRFALAQKLLDEAPEALRESEEHLRVALRLNPDYLVLYHVLGQALAAQKKENEAINILREGIRRVEETGTAEGHDLKPDMEALLDSLE